VSGVLEVSKGDMAKNSALTNFVFQFDLEACCRSSRPVVSLAAVGKRNRITALPTFRTRSDVRIS